MNHISSYFLSEIFVPAWPVGRSLCLVIKSLTTKHTKVYTKVTECHLFFFVLFVRSFFVLSVVPLCERPRLIGARNA